MNDHGINNLMQGEPVTIDDIENDLFEIIDRIGIKPFMLMMRNYCSLNNEHKLAKGIEKLAFKN